MSKKITGDDCVQCLKTMQSSTAADIAFMLNTDSRAVATALRKPVKDGRVKTVVDRKHWRKFGVWKYKFVRSTPVKSKGGAA